jgi:uncharacterized membrane protein
MIMRILFMGWVAILVSSCNYREEKLTKQTLESVNFYSLRDQIFKVNQCLNCHAGPNAEMGIDLSSYTGLMGADPAVIFPGDALKSTLYLNVQSGRMPPGGPRLSDQDIKTLAQWIQNGAKET